MPIISGGGTRHDEVNIENLTCYVTQIHELSFRNMTLLALLVSINIIISLIQPSEELTKVDSPANKLREYLQERIVLSFSPADTLAVWKKIHTTGPWRLVLVVQIFGKNFVIPF